MALLLVNYDLNKEDQRSRDRKKITEYLDDYGGYMLSESCYVIETDKQPGEVYADILHYLDENDDCTVFQLQGKFAGQSQSDIMDFLSEFLEWD